MGHGQFSYPIIPIFPLNPNIAKVETICVAIEDFIHPLSITNSLLVFFTDLKISLKSILFKLFILMWSADNKGSPDNALFVSIDECKNEHESVSQNLILTGFKICESCRISKTIFPV